MEFRQMDPDFGRYRWGVSGFSKGMEDGKEGRTCDFISDGAGSV